MNKCKLQFIKFVKTVLMFSIHDIVYGQFMRSQKIMPLLFWNQKTMISQTGFLENERTIRLLIIIILLSKATFTILRYFFNLS